MPGINMTRRVMMILVEHDEIGDAVFVRPAAQILTQYAAKVMAGEAGKTLQEVFRSPDGFRLSVTFLNSIRLNHDWSESIPDIELDSVLKPVGDEHECQHLTNLVAPTPPSS